MGVEQLLKILSKSSVSFWDSIDGKPSLRYLILSLVLVVFVIALYPSLIVPDRMYQLGDVAARDIKADKDMFFEDKAATAEKQTEAVNSILTVYDYDLKLKDRLQSGIREAFSIPRSMIKKAGKIKKEGTNPNLTVKQPTQVSTEDISAWLWKHKETFEKKLGISLNTASYRILVKERFSEKIDDLIIRIVDEILTNGVVVNKEILLGESEKGITLRTIGENTEKAVFNLRKFYSPEQAKTMVRVVAQPLVRDLNHNVVGLIVDISQRLIQPNVSLNRNETEKRRKNAVEAVKPVMYKIKEGEMLLRNGERVTPVSLLKLKTMYAMKKKEKPYLRSLGALGLFISVIGVLYFLHAFRYGHFSHPPNKDLLFFSVMLILFISLPKLSAVLLESMGNDLSYNPEGISTCYAIPIAAGAMTICLFMGIDFALSFAFILAVCTAIIFRNRFELFIYFFLTGAMAAHWVRNCRERKVFAKAGLKLGLLSVVLIVAIDFYSGDISGTGLLKECAFGFIGGNIAGIITAGLAPIMESMFDYTTDIKLMELANLDQPILKKLMLEAPGTYHHSVTVGSMVEAAASEIGANPLLAKVCGYYHDIGKIRKPLYFVENQLDGRNRHDKLAPSMSGLILISHVKHGVEIAREYKLGKVITETIRQHHGTCLIKYFYEKAKQRKGEDAVKIEDFRYPGPRPQTREAGLVMLADVVEAASRTLDNPTPSRIQGHVQKLINGIFADGQLDNCELTLKDIHNIAKTFIKILNGIHHHRIEYPENVSAMNGKDRHGRSDNQQAKPVKDSNRKIETNGGSHLRRLGIS